ncbi:unnamed protein product [Plutella xylostella]|uniref:(diamondback moth) hypothetical protein n=1 Tax=Plutella xylostella TaxID=51655 RepID=A0A8S4G1C8_PLUXY|nr:unnamed protein product [Plutella xylostella]
MSTVSPSCVCRRPPLTAGGGGGGGGGAGLHTRGTSHTFNVGSGGGSEAYGGGSGSSGAVSPASPPAHAPPAHAPPAHAPPPRLRAKEEDLSTHGRASADGGGSSESEGELGGGAAGAGGARAQYVSANCVVFTHYSGDVAAVVDEHFARALAIDKPKADAILRRSNSFVRSLSAYLEPRAKTAAAVRRSVLPLARTRGVTSAYEIQIFGERRGEIRLYLIP